MDKGTIITLAVIVGLLSGYFGGLLSRSFAGPKSNIQAEEYLLVNDEGEKRAVMKVTRSNKVAVLLYDDQGKIKSGFELDDNGMPEMIRDPRDLY